jgi:Domain of Unknown Function (DUF1086)
MSPEVANNHLLFYRFGFQDFQWQEFIPRLKGKSESEIKEYVSLGSEVSSTT